MPLVGIRKRSVTTIASAIALVFAVSAFLAGCATQAPAVGSGTGDQPPGWFPMQPATQQGQYIFDAYPIIFWIAVAVFVLVEGLLIWIVIRYRRRPTDTELPTQTHGNTLLEVVWTLIPAIIVMGLFVFTVNTLAKVDAPDDTPGGLAVDVTGFQWQWTFAYETQDLSFTGIGSTGPVMVLPINETVRIRLHATDVIHSFYVPVFLYKKDAIPGRVNEFDVNVTQAGTYTGQCAEFCGLQHALMRFTVEAMTRPDFDAWVAQQQAAQSSQAPPPPSGAPTIALSALSSTGFDQSTLSAPADQPIAFDFNNADPGGQPHNVAIKAANPDGTDWVGLPIANAGQQATYVSPPLHAGTYQFFCAVHPTTMTGTLNVGNN